VLTVIVDESRLRLARRIATFSFHCSPTRETFLFEE
jgi:hypothetical protein